MLQLVLLISHNGKVGRLTWNNRLGWPHGAGTLKLRQVISFPKVRKCAQMLFPLFVKSRDRLILIFSFYFTMCFHWPEKYSGASDHFWLNLSTYKLFQVRNLCQPPHSSSLTALGGKGSLSKIIFYLRVCSATERQAEWNLLCRNYLILSETSFHQHIRDCSKNVCILSPTNWDVFSYGTVS